MELTYCQKQQIEFIKEELGIEYDGRGQAFIDDYIRDARESRRLEAEYQLLFGSLLHH